MFQPIKIICLCLCFTFFFAVNSVLAKDMRPLVLYQGSIDDGAFNGSFHAGVERFRTVTGDECEEKATVRDDSVYEKAVHQAVQDGFSPIIIPYGNHFLQLPEIARQYPATRFVVFDVEYDIPNVYSFTYNEHEGAFLAGAIAALTSKSGIVGFITGMNLPIMRRFACGYKQGAKYINPHIHVLDGAVGTEENAWDDQNAAAAVARMQLEEGADVIFQAAGFAGLGVMREVAEAGKFSIGVDMNQNALFPGHVLTSMLKRLDKGVFAALMMARRGIWRDNIKRIGLAQRAVGLAFDKYNEELVPDDVRKRIDAVTGDILMGRIVVHDYLDGNYCPAW